MPPLLDAMLQREVADYELAQTFPAGSPEQVVLGSPRFPIRVTLQELSHTIRRPGRYRCIGARCYAEGGDINSAVGIYKQLMEHGDARLRGLQRNVGYFTSSPCPSTKQYALAADEATHAGQRLTIGAMSGILRKDWAS